MPAASSATPEAVVVDASAIVEALLGTTLGSVARRRMRGCVLHAPAHLDAEVLSALGRLHRAGEIEATTVTAALGQLHAAPIDRHALAPLLHGAWDRRGRMRLVDALYAQLADALGALPLLSTDARLHRASPLVELISAELR